MLLHELVVKVSITSNKIIITTNELNNKKIYISRQNYTLFENYPTCFIMLTDIK